MEAGKGEIEGCKGWGRIVMDWLWSLQGGGESREMVDFDGCRGWV